MLLITTPTGQIGGQVLDRVLDGDTPIRVFARDPTRLPARARERVEVATGSLTDPAAVSDACAGAQTVFFLVPPDSRAASIQDQVLDVVRPLCTALARHDVARVVAVSSLGRGVARRAGQISAIFAVDALIESTGVAYRSVQPPGFMDNLLRQTAALAQGAFYGTQSPDTRVPSVSTRDIAAVATDLLLDPSWSDQRDVPLLGPADLSPDDMAQILTEVLGHPIAYQQITDEAYRETLLGHGASPAAAQGLIDMARAIEDGGYRIAGAPSRASTPTTLRTWAAEVLAPAVAASRAS